MKNIEGIVLKTTAREESGIRFQADLYDFAQPVLGNIASWVNQTLTDIEYNPERASKDAFYHAKAKFTEECRLIAEIIGRISGGKCYCYLETALDFPLESEYDEDYYIEFPAGIRLVLNGETKIFAIDMEMLFTIHRMTAVPEWYKAWAKAYHKI